MPVEVAVYNDGSLLGDKTYTTSELNSMNSSSFEVEDNYIMLENSQMSYLLIEVIDFETAEVTVALQSNASFTYESIKANPYVAATYKTDD